MALPNPIRTWSVYANAGSVTQQANALATIRQTLRLLWASLITRGALTVDYMCDAVTAGTKGDGVNRWDADGDIINAAPGSPHSWAVGTLLGGLGQICIDRDGVLDANGSVYWSESVGFTGGTTTARPTASDEIEITNGGNFIHTGNGSYSWHIWTCSDAGEQGVRFALFNSAFAGGPNVVFSVERPETQLALWTNPVIARWMGGASTFGNRSDWASGAAGWQARISGTVRTLTADGSTPQAALDPDFARLVEPCGLTNATIGDVGFVADWFFQDDGATDLTPYSDGGGAHGYMSFDELVLVWDHTTNLGVANVSAVKVNIIYSADTEAQLISTTPTAGTSLGADFEAARFQPITLVFTVPQGMLPFATVTIAEHSIWHVAFDGADFSPLFQDSSLQIAGETATLTLIPLGGWWGAPEIKVGAFLEAA